MPVLLCTAPSGTILSASNSTPQAAVAQCPSVLCLCLGLSAGQGCWTGDGQHGRAQLLKYPSSLAAAAAVRLGSGWAVCWAGDFAATC